MADSEVKPEQVEGITAEKGESSKTPVEPKTTKKPSQRKKKKVRKTVPSGQVHIQATFNNTMITVTDNKGNTLTASSAGACGFRGSKKGTAYAAQIASEKAADEARQNYGVAKVDVFVNGIGQGREAAIRALQNVDIFVNSIADVTGIPHGGCRPRKARRV